MGVYTPNTALYFSPPIGILITPLGILLEGSYVPYYTTNALSLSILSVVSGLVGKSHKVELLVWEAKGP